MLTTTKTIMAVGSLAVFGCGSNLRPTDGSAGSPSRSARETCRFVGFDDVYTDFVFDVVLADQEAGYSEVEEINSAIAGCRGDFGDGYSTNPYVGPDYTVQQCILDCSACLTAVISEVYR